MLILDIYIYHRLVDGLPGLSQDNSDLQHRKWSPQFKMGDVDKYTGKAFIYNHFNIHLLYQPHPTDANTKYIVGFEVYPSSYVMRSFVNIFYY